MSCQAGCGLIKLRSRVGRQSTVVAAVPAAGRQAYLLAQQRLLTERLATLAHAEHGVAVQQIQTELTQLASQLTLVS
ncbi:hypothetical protein RA086_10060 [Lactiplantibacillus sp. WILCCON 0030]|uniref:Uncharacterized protein n=1 Tax=Lactiplantibacillus brownii TaxID=3069269 RepID=A0ABU1AAD2_9LACO|nr:hypothetical protein [Lactiplantibacillus brownii]MDQ7937952.1 hypothetical protein [Lactiplantibacillus brownii]